MSLSRRKLLTSFASVGPMGAMAAAFALTGCADSGNAQSGNAGSGAGSGTGPAAGGKFGPSVGGRGPGLEGPYLDLRTGRGNQLAYARIQGDLDPTKQKYFWFKGYVSGIEPNKKVVDLVGAQGFGAIRLITRPDGVIERLCREIIVYTDLRSGEVIQEWDNPLTNERVNVVHVDNDPFNYLIEEYFPEAVDFGGQNVGEKPPRIPFLLPWYQHGSWLEMEIHIHLAYPNALQPDKWPRESSGPIAQVSEYFAHHIRAEDMQNEALTSLPYLGTWNRTTPWLPWMLMGQRPGHCQYNCFMGNTYDLEEIFSRNVLDYAEKHYAKYFNAPEKWTDQPSMSSLEHYARQQKPAPVK